MKNRIWIAAAALMLAVAGCSVDNGGYWSENPPQGEPPGTSGGDNNGTEGTDPGEGEVPEVPQIETGNEDDLVENSTFSKQVAVTFSGGSVAVTDGVEGVSADISGAGVTIASTVKEVEYVVSGDTPDGFLKIYSDYKFKLTLDGVSMTNNSGPAINIQSGKRCFVVLAPDKANSLTDGAVYATGTDGEDMKGCFFSEGELIFSGTGAIAVKGNYKHGICSDDYVRIRDGVIVVESAASDGVHTNDAFIMDGGTLTVTSEGDGIECGEGYILIQGGSLTVNPGDDGIAVSYEEGDAAVNNSLLITGGSVVVNTSARKGHALKSTGDILISGGIHDIAVKGAAAKGINADGNVVISGGDTTVATSGDTIVENSDTSSASGVKTGGDFGMTAGTLTVRSSGTGGKGVNIGGNFVIADGMLSVATSGGRYNSGGKTSSPKGIKADGSVTVNGGTCVVSATHEGIESPSRISINGGVVEVTATDDAMNVSNRNGVIAVAGGMIYCYSSGNDGIDSNGTILISGGTVVSSGTKTPEEGFDCDNNAFEITGGTVIGTGGATSYPSLASGQHAVIYGTSASAGDCVQLKNAAGESLIIYKVPRTYSSMTMLLSHQDVAKNGSCSLVKGGTVSGGTEFHGYYTGAVYAGGSSLSVTTGASAYTTAGSSSGGNPGGGPGGRP